MLILQRAGDDFGGRGRTRVDQHDHRLALRQIAGFGEIAFDIALAAPALRHDLAALKEDRSEEHTSELQSLMRISYAVFCLKKKKKKIYTNVEYKTKNNT